MLWRNRSVLKGSHHINDVTGTSACTNGEGELFTPATGIGNHVMKKTIKQLIMGCLAIGSVAWAQSRADAQIYNWDNTDAAGGSWSQGSNWDSGIAPEGLTFAEGGRIANGGTAFVDENIPAGPGEILVENGILEIRNGGTLATNDTEVSSTGDVSVGEGNNDAHLKVLGGSLTGSSLTVNAGSADTSVQLSGTGSLSITGGASLQRTTRITGDTATFSVGGDLTIGGNFISEITNALSHTAIGVIGGVTISNGAALNVEFNGPTPSSGDNWTLVSGSTGVTGNFGSISGPALGNGLGYKVGTAGGDVTLSVSNLLTLTVDRTTGAASITDLSGAIAAELYNIRSPAGNLTPATWQSLADNGFDGGTWLEGLPNGGNPFGLAEAHANPLGSSTFAAGQPESIGTILDTSPLPFGETHEDLTFGYLEPGNVSDTVGNIEYVGSHNNLVLIADPATGEAAIQNQSVTDVSISIYSIHSDDGSLIPDSGETLGVGWDSFEESGVDGGAWQRGFGSNVTLVEANPASSTLIASGSVFDIGTPFSVGGSQDLEFEFLLDGETIKTLGVVEYGPVIVTPRSDGDFNESGLVDVADLNLVLFNWDKLGSELPEEWKHMRPDNEVPVSVTELNKVLFTWAQTFSPTATVPEPSGVVWLCLGAILAVSAVNRKKEGLA